MCDAVEWVGKRYFLLDRGAVKPESRISRRMLGASFYIFFPILIAVACRIDGTWSLPDPNKGLCQHYGFWTIFITTPIILLLTSRLLYDFSTKITNIDSYCIEMPKDLRRGVEILVSRHLRSLGLQTKTVAAFGGLVAGLLGWCVYNILKTIAPKATYHHDVFDSYAHPYGFVTTKVYVFLVVAIVYAVAIFVAVHVTVSLVSIMKFVCRYGVIRVNFFHVDNCGGMSAFGNLNLMILAIYANFFAVVYAMHITHRATYLVMFAALWALSLLSIAQSVGAVYYIHVAIAKKKTDCLNSVVRRLNDLVSSSLPPKNAFPNDLLTLRNHVAGIHTFPYAKSAAAVVNIIRFVPAAIAVAGLIPK